MTDLDDSRASFESAWKDIRQAVTKETGVKLKPRWVGPAVAAAAGLVAAAGVKRIVSARKKKRLR